MYEYIIAIIVLLIMFLPLLLNFSPITILIYYAVVVFIGASFGAAMSVPDRHN